MIAQRPPDDGLEPLYVLTPGKCIAMECKEDRRQDEPFCRGHWNLLNQSRQRRIQKVSHQAWKALLSEGEVTFLMIDMMNWIADQERMHGGLGRFKKRPMGYDPEEF